MPLDKRTLAALAFWNDEDSPDIEMQHVEAMASLARRLNFRAKSIQTMTVDRRAKHLAQMGDVSEAIASRALIAYHFADQRAVMSAFLDALGIAHENGLIKEEDIAKPDKAKVEAAVTAVKATHDADDVDLYLRTLAALDPDTWAVLDEVIPPIT